VRSSVARRLGVGNQEGPNAPGNVEGLLDSMDDAVTRRADAVTHERLHAWQAALFPTGYSGMTRIRVGGYREHAGTSRATASRELIELAKLGLLAQTGAGRSTRYYVKLPGWAPVEVK